MDNWYYIRQQKSVGPLTEIEFTELVKQAVIQDKTLVWNPRMHYGWVKYESLTPHDFTQKVSSGQEAEKKPTENESRCVECGKTFLRAEMIPYNQFFVCASCKPVFIQKIKEGAYKEESVQVTGEMRYAGFWIRVAAKLIDQIILYIINIPTTLLSSFLMVHWTKNMPNFFIIKGNITLLGMFITAAYNILLVGKYGATIGKMVFHLRIVTADRKKVSYLRALGRHFAEFISSIVCGIGYIMVAFDDEKRGLHDHICNTRVIKR